MKNGIIYNPNFAKQTIFFDREYTNIDLKHSEASRFVDMIGNSTSSTSLITPISLIFILIVYFAGPNEDTEATNLLKQLKQQVTEKMLKESICNINPYHCHSIPIILFHYC